MVELTISYARENYEEIFLLGVRLQPGPQPADLYALVLYYEVARGDANRPLTSDGRIVFFRAIAQATAILQLGDAAFRKYGKAPGEVAYCYDLPEVLSRIATGARDDGAHVLNFINELLDFVRATEHVVPEHYLRTLTTVADWLTFDKRIAAVADTRGVQVTEIRDALFWCLGAIASNASIVD